MHRILSETEHCLKHLLGKMYKLKLTGEIWYIEDAIDRVRCIEREDDNFEIESFVEHELTLTLAKEKSKMILTKEEFVNLFEVEDGN